MLSVHISALLIHLRVLQKDIYWSKMIMILSTSLYWLHVQCFSLTFWCHGQCVYFVNVFYV